MGELNDIKNTIEDALVNGVDENGVTVEVEEEPTYGGTEENEDFEGFNVYIVNNADLQDPRGHSLPALVVNIEVGDGGTEFVDGDESDTVTIAVYIMLPFFHTVTIDDVKYEKAVACDEYVERLKTLMAKFELPEMTVLSSGRVSPYHAASENYNNSNIWLGAVTKTFEIVPGGL